MKAKKLALLFLLPVLICSGCSSSKSSEQLKTLTEKIQQLEADMVDMQEEITKTKLVINTETVTNTLASIDALTSSVTTLVDKITRSAPTGTDEQRMNQYFDLKNSVKQLEKKIDAYDDNLEIQYKNNTLSYTDYRIQEREAASLSTTLKEAETQLRLIYHMNED